MYNKKCQKKIVKFKGKLEQRIIITYSRKAAEYQKKIRNKQIERAKASISKEKDEYILDEELIANEAKFDDFMHWLLISF